MNILFICNEYPPEPHGGLGVFVQSMAQALSRDGHDVIVVGVYQSVQSVSCMSDGFVKVYKFPGLKNQTRFAFFAERFRFAKFISRLVRENKINLVESPEGGGWSVFVRVDCPLVIRLHNLTPVFSGRKRGKLMNIIEGLALRRSTRVIAVSRYMVSVVLGLYPFSGLEKREIFIVYNGIDTDIFRYRPYEQAIPGRIVFAGTIKPLKNVEILLAAFTRVWRENKSVQLNIFGKDTFVDGKSYCESLTDALPQDIQKSITYHGPVSHDQMPMIFASAQVCVFPSIVESFGLVAAEAMACGRPVIYSSNGPGSELITDGFDGFLCDPADEIMLAGLIKKTLASPDESRVMGWRASETIKSRFELQKAIVENVKFYETCIENHKRM